MEPLCTDACSIEMTGRLASSTEPGLTPYALIAYDQPSGDDEFWVQYDSTFRDGTSWESSAYVEGSSPGDAFLLQAVLVRGSVLPPADPNQGLRWQQAVEEQGLDVVAKSAVVRVTIGRP